jgi:cellulose synthase/poly-beta-1,6-N-acetylglucosamine synthase-like glycosyltransferase
VTGSTETSVTVSVIIAAHTFERCDDLTLAVESAIGQQSPPYEVVVAVDNNPDLYEWVCKKLPDVVAVDHRGARGAGSTRNSGARAAYGSILAFLDDDAIARPGWLRNLSAPLARPDVVGVGGQAEPVWRGPVPKWLPAEFLWVVGASYLGMPKAAAPIRNVWSQNMAVRRADFWKVGGFREGFGKVGLESTACDDTDLCIRMSAATGGIWWYEPSALIGHVVPVRRGTPRFFVQRCYTEGKGKADMAVLLGPSQRLQDERRHATKTLPQGLRHELWQAVTRREFAAMQRASAIAVGLGAASAGYAFRRARRVSVSRGQHDERRERNSGL